MTRDPALPEAAFDDDVSLVKRLVKRGVHLESVDASGQTALGNAALAGNLALVKFLLAAGANAKHVSPKVEVEPAAPRGRSQRARGGEGAATRRHAALAEGLVRADRARRRARAETRARHRRART
ncbi:MAG: ankyrin repeat domain-containing protein [Archangium sp.]|nr:ankyrin repeat domain-containing protein [Archangium sp.]